MTNVSYLTKTMLLCAAAAAASIPAYAQWEQSLRQVSTQSVFVTSSGTVLAGDQDNNLGGGIFYSTDEGGSWEKADIADKWWCRFFEAGDYVFAIAEYEPRIARSEDGGKTWISLSYERAIQDIVSTKELPYVHAYTASYDEARKRIYLPLYSETAGVIYSDDFGESWKSTDRESLLINWGDAKSMDNFYGSTMFSDDLYALGLYGLWKYDADTDLWSPVRDNAGNVVNSNALVTSIVRNGKFIAGHAAPSTEEYPEYLLSSTDMKTFTPMPKPYYPVEGVPEGQDGLSWYVRGMTQDADCIYTGLISSHIFYSSDEGETWTFFSDGLPKKPYGTDLYETNTIALAASDNYLFAAQFAVYGDYTGIWRVKKPEITGIQGVASDELRAVYAQGILSVNVDEASFEIFSLDGSRVLAATGESVSTSSLIPGIYVYRINTGGNTLTGKINVK